MAKKKLTQIERKYYKKRKSLYSQIAYRNTGEKINNIKLPKIPKKITQGSLNKLNAITTKKLNTQTKYVDLETGEIKNKPQNKTAKTKKRRPPSKADVVIQNFRGEMAGYNDIAYNIISNWLDNVIAQTGKVNTAKMLSNAYATGVMPDNKVVYNEELLRERLGSMLELMELEPITRDNLEEAWEGDELW